MTNGRAKIDYGAFVKEDRIHGRVYTDPDIFEEELDKIFCRGWVYIGPMPVRFPSREISV